MRIFQVLIVFIICFSIGIPARAQLDMEYWHLSDQQVSGFPGISLEKLYAEIGEQKASKTVVVAIIDSGVDIEHEDLKTNLWINTDEIPGNDIDDDANGYVDDIYGWNFLGNPDGTNVIQDSYEVTRLYAKYRAYFAEKDISALNRKDRNRHEAFLKYKKVVERERRKAQRNLNKMREQETVIVQGLTAVQANIEPGTKINAEVVSQIDPGENRDLDIGKQILQSLLEQNVSIGSIDELLEEVAMDFGMRTKPNRDKLDYGYNPDFNSRELIDDNYEDAYEIGYGNNDVQGEFSFHGTHVAGIVAADRLNDIGVRGIAENVRIMSLRAVPDGDEHDKDVANAIRYAVDNGAAVINMSFGKGQSWDKKAVDKAVKYAAKNDVLLVHAAGNSGQNNDTKSNFPNDQYEKKGLFGKKFANNWIEVGALNLLDGDNSVASFSNYGARSVDILAPGVQIYSTAPANTYAYAQGTSMASPVVAGVASLLRSYFPSLTATQVKDIILQSATPLNGELIRPGSFDRVSASEICLAGGSLNAYEAYRLAAKTKGKKKMNKDQQVNLRS